MNDIVPYQPLAITSKKSEIIDAEIVQEPEITILDDQPIDNDSPFNDFSKAIFKSYNQFLRDRKRG